MYLGTEEVVSWLDFFHGKESNEIIDKSKQEFLFDKYRERDDEEKMKRLWRRIRTWFSCFGKILEKVK